MKRIMYILVALVSVALLFSCATERSGETTLYVSTAGNDTWSGKLPEPNSAGTDGPFATLERARDTVREMKQAGTGTEQGITVSIRGGRYEITKTLELTAQDSGAETAPIVWRASPGETVVFSGGKIITGFTPVTDTAVLGRIDETCRDKILQADLGAQGITEYGTIDPRSGHRMELYFGNKFMTIARYPDEGWLTIADIPQTGDKMIHRGLGRDKSPVPRGRHYGRFTYDGDRPNRWAESKDIWVHGYWTWDWSDQYLPVDKIDKKKRDIYPKEPHHGYGYTKGQRYYFLNVLEELDSPGEWFVDTAKGMVYFWPPSPIGEKDVVVSRFEDVMISLKEASYILIRGIRFESSRGGAVSIEDGTNNTVAGCAMINLGKMAVSITGGTENGVLSCDIYDVAAGGIELHGGDLPTLSPAGNYARNNHIHDFAIRLKTYQPAVLVTGVGNRVAHNLIHDAPHTGIFLSTSRVGNEHVIEFNELYSLAKETGDVGAIYLCSRNYTFRGTVIRHNYLHHLLGPGLYGVMGVYLDDFTSGTTIYGNVFYQAGRASFVGGGRNNTIENNIYVECGPSTHVDARGMGWASGSLQDGKEGRMYKLMEEMNFTEPPYSERYPELLTLFDDEPAVPKYNKIVRNVSYGGRWLDLYNGMNFDIVSVTGNLIADPDLCQWQKKGTNETKTYPFADQETRNILEENGNTVIDTDPGFVDVKNGNFQLRDDSPAWKLGFKKIPFDKIGLYLDEYRKTLPQR